MESVCLRPVLLCASLVFASAFPAHGWTQAMPVMAQEESASLPPEAPGEASNKVVEFAKTLIGVRYRYGGTSPETGLDCSGFIGYVLRHTMGIEVPRRVKEISSLGRAISLSDLQPGDLVFFNTRGYRYSHAGIYLGNNRFIHSPSSGKKVHIADMSLKYWSTRFNGGRRLVPGAGTASGRTLEKI